MSTVRTENPFCRVWQSVVAWGVLTLISGVVVLVWPGISIEVASILFGVFLVVSGIAQVVFAFTLEMSAGSRIPMFISGALSLALGVLAFRHFVQGSAVLLLAIWIGAALFFQGVGEAVTSIDDPVRPGRDWHIFLGIVTAIAGVVVLAWPFKSIAVLAIVAGIELVLVGISQIVSAFRAGKAVNEAQRGLSGRRAPSVDDVADRA